MRSSRLFIALLLPMATSFSQADQDPPSFSSEDPPTSIDADTTTVAQTQAGPSKGVFWNIEGEPLTKVDANATQVGMYFGVHELNGKSFRLRLGTPDECSTVVLCVGKVNVNQSGFPDNYRKAANCHKEIIFSLKERSVKVNGQNYPFASSVADFLTRNKKVTLTVATALQGSNTADLKPQKIETTWDAQKDTHITVMASGSECPGIVNTFSRHDHTRYYMKEKERVEQEFTEPNAHTGQGKTGVPMAKSAVALHGGVPGTKQDKNSALAKQCQKSILGETGVHGFGDFINVLKGAPKAFKYTLGTASGDAFKQSTDMKLHLEIRNPLQCDWIRMCFEQTAACKDPTKVVDLIMRHRFFIQTDYIRGRIFDTPINQTDLFTFTFRNTFSQVLLETKPAEHGQPLSIPMKLTGFEFINDAVIHVLASRCNFRLSKARSPVDREQSRQDTSAFKRNNGFIKSCVEVTH